MEVSKTYLNNRSKLIDGYKYVSKYAFYIYQDSGIKNFSKYGKFH